MKTILLMRHAKAAKELPGQDDFDRPLTDEGRQVALQTGCLLASMGIQLDRVIASSALRTAETAQIVASTVTHRAEIVLMEELYNAPTLTVQRLLRKQMFDQESCLLMVGHNPGIAGVMFQWSAKCLSVPPATVAVFRSRGKGWHSINSETGSGMELAGIIQRGALVWKDSSAVFTESTDS